MPVAPQWGIILLFVVLFIAGWQLVLHATQGPIATRVQAAAAQKLQ